MGFKVIITGATGMVGKGVLLECIDSKLIDQVLIVGRSPSLVKQKKVKEVLVEDFFHLESIEDQIKGYDACFFCLGTTSFGLPEVEYSRITYGITTHFAKTYFRKNPDSIFSYVSGAGTDGTKKSRIMWTRVKGNTENALMAMGFKKAYMYRPGYIHPMRGIQSKTAWIRVLYALFSPVYLILKQIPGAATSTENVGKSMIQTLSSNYPNSFLGNKEINNTAAQIA